MNRDKQYRREQWARTQRQKLRRDRRRKRKHDVYGEPIAVQKAEAR